MAQRRGLDCNSSSANRVDLRSTRMMPLIPIQPEEFVSVPLHPGHLPRDGAERFVLPLLVTKPTLQHFDRYVLSLELTGEPGTCVGHPGILGSASSGELLQK